MELSIFFFKQAKKYEEKDMDCRRSLLKFNRIKKKKEEEEEEEDPTGKIK